MMNMPIAVMLVSLCVGFLALGASAASSANVRDFGAIGDGVHDDTLALQRAADALWPCGCEKGFRFLADRPEPSRRDGPNGELYFPAGIYRISRTVVLEGSANLRGEKGSVLRMTAVDRDCLYFHRAYRNKIVGLTIEGGRNQVRFWTSNQESSHIALLGCMFRNAVGTAVVCDSWRFDPHQDVSSSPSNIAKLVYASPYEIIRGTNGLYVLKDRDFSQLARTYNSTLFSVSGCGFAGNARAVSARADGVIVRDSDFVGAEESRHEQLHLGGVSHVSRCRIKVGDHACAAVVATGHDAHLTDTKLYLAGEVPGILSTTPTFSWLMGSRLTLKDVGFKGGNGPVIRYAASTMPAITAVFRLSADDDVLRRVFDFEREPTEGDLLTLTAGDNPRPRLPIEKSIVISTGEYDRKTFTDVLPSVLERCRREVPAGVVRRVDERPTQLSFGTVVVEASGLGAEDMLEDAPSDSSRLQDIVCRVAAGGGGTVVLPSRWLRFETSVTVPSNIKIISRGRTVVTRSDDGGPIFVIEEGSSVWFENLVFRRGRHAVVCLGGKGFVRFRDCFFYAQREASIVAAAGIGNCFRVEVTGGVANTPQLYAGNAKPALFDGLWFTMRANHRLNEWRDEAYGFLNLEGGRLELYDILGVPCVWEFFEKNMKPVSGMLDGGQFHPRWIDNYGKLTALAFRFGGEWGGVTPVYHHGKSASTYLEGEISSTRNARLKAGPAQVASDVESPDVTVAHLISFNFTDENPVYCVTFGKDGNPAPTPMKSVNCFPCAK